MRALALLLMMSGCTDVRTCKSGTLLVHLTLDSTAAQADSLVVTISVDGVAHQNAPVTHKAGATSGNLEVDFPSGYRQNAQVIIEVSAQLGGAEIAHRASDPVPLQAGCTATHLDVVAGQTSGDLSRLVLNDLSTGDLVEVPDLVDVPDLSGADLARTIDLAGIDLANCMALTEDCFNGKDDDCDGLVDCDDPDCVGGASPKAVCVPDPMSFTAGTVASSCPAAWPTSTAIYQNLQSSCQNVSCGGCSHLTSSFGGPDDCFALLYDNGNTPGCLGGTGLQLRASGTPECRQVDNIVAGDYHSIDTGYYDGYCNDPTGTATKVTPTWGNSKLFCRGGVVGGGCTAGYQCVPAAPNHCVMKLGSQLPCPTGYTVQAPYYTGFDDTNRTCQCGCFNSVQGSCSGTPTVSVYTGAGCSGSSMQVLNSCSNVANLASYPYANATGRTITQHATCVAQPYENTPPTKTGEQTVCCVP